MTIKEVKEKIKLIKKEILNAKNIIAVEKVRSQKNYILGNSDDVNTSYYIIDKNRLHIERMEEELKYGKKLLRQLEKNKREYNKL